LLAKGIEEDRKEFAAKIFEERKVSLREAAEGLMFLASEIANKSVQSVLC
jgi:hypothetical protein